jgi:hypothetical protein
METQTKRGRDHVNTEAEVGVMLPQAKEPLGPPGAEDFFQNLQK